MGDYTLSYYLQAEIDSAVGVLLKLKSDYKELTGEAPPGAAPSSGGNKKKDKKQDKTSGAAAGGGGGGGKKEGKKEKGSKGTGDSKAAKDDQSK